MESTDRLTLSVLVTREEYSEAAAQQQRKEHHQKVSLNTISGAVLIVLGIAGVFFGNLISLTFSVAFGLILLGVFQVCYDGFFAPLLSSAAAAREFDLKEDLHFATTFIFKDESVTVCNGRVEGDLPLSQITRWSETPALFTMAYGRELSFAIPKRLLTTDECYVLRQLLGNNAPNANR